MPIYEYRCGKCDAVFEELVFGDKLVPCPKCGSEKTEKLISRTQRHKSAAQYAEAVTQATTPSSGGGCSGCAGGSCSTCH